MRVRNPHGSTAPASGLRRVVLRLPLLLGLLLLGLMVFAGAAQAALETYDFVGTVGGPGAGNGQFSQPCGPAIDGQGNLYVADNLNSRIQKFTSAGVFVASFGTPGAGNGQLSSPHGVAVDATGNTVFVADTGNNRIQKFTSVDGITYTYGGVQWGTPSGPGDGQLNLPWGVALDATGFVYVADTFNSRVQKFTDSGVFQAKFGAGAPVPFFWPFGVTVDATGNVYVADVSGGWRGHVQVFTPVNMTTYRFLRMWGDNGTADGDLAWSSGVALDTTGNVFVTDAINNRVQKFSSGGVLEANFGAAGAGAGQFSTPIGIGVTAKGTVWVADTNNHRLQRWDPRDTVGPTTLALANVSVARGAKAKLKYRVTDNWDDQVTVTIKIRRGSKTVKTFSLGLRAVGTDLSKSFTCNLAVGSYTYRVLATDAAGNKQVSPPGSKALTVH